MGNAHPVTIVAPLGIAFDGFQNDQKVTFLEFDYILLVTFKCI